MEHIGQRIKDLRKKADLTQDRLADYLGVSAQAVSKWECDISTPDLSLIPPLCRVLGCTSDELLGIDPTEDDEGAKELSRELEHLTGEDLDRFKEIVALAAQKYPRNEQISYRIAAAEYWWFGGKTSKTEEERRRKEDAEKRLLALLADGKNEIWRAYAASDLFRMRMNDGLREEAKVFAEQSGSFRDEHLLECLDGEEWTDRQQFLVYRSLNRLCNYLEKRGKREDHLPSWEAVENVVGAILTDRNCVGYSNRLKWCAWKQAGILIKAGEYERAVGKLRDWTRYVLEEEHWIHWTRANPKEDVIPYTSPVLDHFGEDVRTFEFGEHDLFGREEIRMCLNYALLDPLRDRDDFKALIAELESSTNSEQEETV